MRMTVVGRRILELIEDIGVTTDPKHDGADVIYLPEENYKWLVENSYALASQKNPGILRMTEAGRRALNSVITYTETYLAEVRDIANDIENEPIEQAIDLLRQLRERRGRLFILGNGGSAANASHAVNDFRKIAGIEAYAPTDNVAELTAWANDAGWDSTFSRWLEESAFCNLDLLLVLSVGGGSETTSANIVRAIRYADYMDAHILSIVSRDGGLAKELSDVCILVPVISEERITPHAESWQSIICHLLCNALGEPT